MRFWKRRDNQPKVVQAPMDDDEMRRIAEAEAEMPSRPDPAEPDVDNMPPGLFFPQLRNSDGLRLKPVSQQGTLGFRSSDDMNARLEENTLRAMRQKTDD